MTRKIPFAVWGKKNRCGPYPDQNKDNLINRNFIKLSYVILVKLEVSSESNVLGLVKITLKNRYVDI